MEQNGKIPDEMGQNEIMIPVRFQRKLQKLTEDQRDHFYLALGAAVEIPGWQNAAVVFMLVWAVLAYNVKIHQKRKGHATKDVDA